MSLQQLEARGGAVTASVLCALMLALTAACGPRGGGGSAVRVQGAGAT